MDNIVIMVMLGAIGIVLGCCAIGLAQSRKEIDEALKYAIISGIVSVLSFVVLLNYWPGGLLT